MNGKGTADRNVTTAQIFYTGAIGSIAPQILDWYAKGISLPGMSTQTLGAAFVTLAFMGLAGYIAVIWGEKNLMKVFYIGISAPAIILSSANNITFEKPVPEILSQEIPSSNDVDTREDNGAFFFFSPTEAYAFDRPDTRVVAAVEGSGDLELTLAFKEGTSLENATIFLKDPETGKVLAKVRPKAPHIRISYFTGTYDIVVEVDGYSSDPKSKRVEIKTGETVQAKFVLTPMEKDFKYHIQEFIKGTKERF